MCECPSSSPCACRACPRIVCILYRPMLQLVAVTKPPFAVVSSWISKCTQEHMQQAHATDQQILSVQQSRGSQHTPYIPACRFLSFQHHHTRRCLFCHRIAYSPPLMWLWRSVALSDLLMRNFITPAIINPEASGVVADTPISPSAW